ncbi:MAG: hypothetical protein HZB98_16120, partial [Bacteroidia bacterium]|nr:hypothetical protein [Bacteroidia bacterium]
RSAGFTLGPATVTHGYTYSQTNVVTGPDVTEDEYVAARFFVPASTWTKGVADDVDDVTNNIIGEPGSGSFLENVTFIDGDYTAGDDNPTSPFGTPTIFYSRINGAGAGSGLWSDVNTWSLTGHTGAPGATVPGSGDIVIIGGRDSVYLATDVSWPYTTPNVDPRSCASLQIETGSALDIGYNPASVFGMVVSHPSGNGNFRLTTSSNDGSVFQFPAGDFSDFNVNRGTTEFYSTNPAIGPIFILSPAVTSFGTVILSPLGGSNIALPNAANVLIYGDLICRGQTWESWLAMTWNGAYGAIVPKTVNVRGNLHVQGGSFIWAFNGAIAQNIIVDGNVIVDPGAGIDVYSGTNNTMSIGGSLINNSDNSGPAIYGGFAGSNVRLVRAAGPAGVANVTFFGTNNGLITNNPAISANPNTTFNSVTVNKGSSQATTLTVDIGGVLTTPADNWLTLQNGTLRFMRTNPGTDFTISQGTPFNIPATAGLHIDYSNASARNVLIGNINNTSGDLTLSGKLTIVNGNVYIGPVVSTVSANDIEYTSSGASSIVVQGGNLIVNGQIRRNPLNAAGILKYSQSAGSVTIRGQAANNTNAKLEVLNDGSDFTMTGGQLTIVRGNGGILTPSSPFGDLYLRPQTGSVTGGTIEFAHTGINAPHNYFIDANIPLNNLIVTGLTAANYSALRILTSPLVVNGDMTINANSVLDANNINVTFNGNLINTPGVTGYIAGTNLTTFSATVGSVYVGAQTITGQINFYDLNVS